MNGLVRLAVGLCGCVSSLLWSWFKAGLRCNVSSIHLVSIPRRCFGIKSAREGVWTARLGWLCGLCGCVPLYSFLCSKQVCVVCPLYSPRKHIIEKQIQNQWKTKKNIEGRNSYIKYHEGETYMYYHRLWCSLWCYLYSHNPSFTIQSTGISRKSKEKK